MTERITPGTVESTYHPYWPDYFDPNVIVYQCDEYAIDAQDNICRWTRNRYPTADGGTWESPHYWEAWYHIEEVTRLPDGLVWIRGRHLYTGTDYSREEWEAEAPSYQYIIARQTWLTECRQSPVRSKVWDFDNNWPPHTPYYPFYPPRIEQSALPLFTDMEVAL